MGLHFIANEAFFPVDEDEGYTIITEDSHIDHSTIATKVIGSHGEDSHIDHGTIATKVTGSHGEDPTEAESPADVWWQCDLSGSELQMAPIHPCGWSMVEGNAAEETSQDMISETGVDENRPIDFPENIGSGRMEEGGDGRPDAEEELISLLYTERYGQMRPSFYQDSFGFLRTPKLDVIKKDLGQGSARRNLWAPCALDEEFLLSTPTFKAWDLEQNCQ